MIIETRRLQFTELNLTDVNTLADIAKDMAWNDTVNILLRTDLTSQNFKECGKSRRRIFPCKKTFLIDIWSHFIRKAWLLHGNKL